MTAARRLVLLRHGQTAWNLERRGRRATPTSRSTRPATPRPPRPRRTLAALSRARLWSCDLARARETAAYVADATGLELGTDARLREYDVGVRHGLTRAEFAAAPPARARRLAGARRDACAGGEESPTQVRARVRRRTRRLSRRARAGRDRDRRHPRRVPQGRPGRTARLAGRGVREPCAAWTTAAGPCSASTTSKAACAWCPTTRPPPSARTPTTPAGAISLRTTPLAKIPRVAHRTGRQQIWGCGAAGSAPAWHAGGQGFESPQLHATTRTPGESSQRFRRGCCRCVDRAESALLLPPAEGRPTGRSADSAIASGEEAPTTAIRSATEASYSVWIRSGRTTREKASLASSWLTPWACNSGSSAR